MTWQLLFVQSHGVLGSACGQTSSCSSIACLGSALQCAVELHTGFQRKFHAHVMLQFKSEVDRTVSAFVFERLKPNVSPTDLCGDGLCRKKLQMSIGRGFFYVWANKIGTARLSCGGLCVAGNYAPVWTDELFRYQVLGAWPEKLWKQRKVTTEVYKEYLYLTRDG